jgi:gamma-glutamylcysteine synthetase
MSAFPFMTATERAEAQPVPHRVAAAQAFCALLSDEQKVALAIELVRDITATSCRLPLRRLISAADATASNLRDVAFARGEIV